jgi:hypothetical protein
LIPLFFVVPAIFNSHQVLLRSSGLSTSLGLIALGLTPFDVAYVAHHAALVLWMGGLLIQSLAMAANVGCDGAGGKLLIAATTVLVAAIGGFVFAHDHDGHVFYQKVVVLLAALWTIGLVIAVSVTAHSVTKSWRQMVDMQARRYLRQLELGGWRR